MKSLEFYALPVTGDQLIIRRRYPNAPRHTKAYTPEPQNLPMCVILQILIPLNKNLSVVMRQETNLKFGLMANVTIVFKQIIVVQIRSNFEWYQFALKSNLIIYCLRLKKKKKTFFFFFFFFFCFLLTLEHIQSCRKKKKKRKKNSFLYIMYMYQRIFRATN